MSEFTDDLAELFSATELATAATLQGGSTVNVHFDQEYVRALDMVAGTNPVALAIATSVVAGDVGKTLTINGTVYTIRDRRPVDDGATVILELEA